MGNMINLTSPREINRFSLKSHTSPLFQLRWVQLSAGGVPKFCRVWKGWLEGGEFEHNNSYKFKFSGKNMENIITKPRFEKSMKITTMALPDVNLVFSTKRVEPMSFADLRNADYGKGFRMSTMPELVSLIYASFKNQEYETTKNFIKIFKNEWFPGNTGIYSYPEGMFAKDNPEMENKKIIPFDYKTLESKLGKHEEKGVVFSDDKTLRFTPYNYKREYQSSLELSKNTGIIALVSGEENAEKLARASEHYKGNPYFWAFSHVDFPQEKITIACLGTDILEDWLSVGVITSEDGNYWGSFGVREMDIKNAG